MVDISGGDTPLNKTLQSFCLEFDPPPRSKAQEATEDKAEDDEALKKNVLETPPRFKWEHFVQISSLIKMGFPIATAKDAILTHEGDFMAALNDLVLSEPFHQLDDGGCCLPMPSGEPSLQKHLLKVGRLVEKGFEPSTAAEALRNHGGNVQAAKNALQPDEEGDNSVENYRVVFPPTLARSFSSPGQSKKDARPEFPLQRTLTTPAVIGAC